MKKLFDEIPRIEDDYIILREMTEKDADMIEAMSKSDNVMRYLPTFLFEYQFKDKKDAIRQMYRDLFIRKESLLLGIYLKSNPEQMVGVGEIYNYDPHWNKASIGGRIHESYWHMDIASHTIALLKNYLFGQTDVKRITAHIMEQNKYSQMSVTRCGFRLRQASVAEDWGFEQPVLVNKYILEKLGNIKYVKIGDGPKTMVVLPGLAFKTTLGSADLLRSSFAMFQDYTIYLFDDRSNIGEGYTLRERAGDIAAEMKTLGIYDAYVYGVSMGSMTAQYLAIDHPDLVRKLFLAASCCYINPKAAAVVSHWKRLAESGEKEELIQQTIHDIYSSETLEKFENILTLAIGNVTDQELSDFVALVSACLDFDSRNEIHKITCPVFLAGSWGDRVLFPEGSRQLTELLNCESFMYDKSYGHAFYDEDRDFKYKVLSFFSEYHSVIGSVGRELCLD